MKRVVYYVWWATTEENDNGTHHKSEPITLPAKAQEKANEMWKVADYVSIDQSFEQYVNGEWETIETKVIEVI